MARMNRRRALQLAGSAAAAALLPRSVAARETLLLNDASRLNPTPIKRHWIVGPDDEKTLIERLRTELKAGQAEKRPIAVSVWRVNLGETGGGDRNGLRRR